MGKTIDDFFFALQMYELNSYFKCCCVCSKEVLSVGGLVWMITHKLLDGSQQTWWTGAKCFSMQKVIFKRTFQMMQESW